MAMELCRCTNPSVPGSFITQPLLIGLKFGSLMLFLPLNLRFKALAFFLFAGQICYGSEIL